MFMGPSRGLHGYTRSVHDLTAELTCFLPERAKIVFKVDAFHWPSFHFGLPYCKGVAATTQEWIIIRSLSHYDKVKLDVKYLDMQVQLLTAAKDIILQEEQKLQDDAERATTTSDEDDLLQNTGAARRRRRRRSECGCDLGF